MVRGYPASEGTVIQARGAPVRSALQISVIIPALNAAWCLVHQLAALRAQRTDTPFEIIVADNGSTDGTAELARANGARVVDASAVRGPAVARNAGAAAANGEYLVFLDADDVVAPGYLQAVREALDEHDLVGSRVDQTELNPGWRSFSRVIEQQEGLPILASSSRPGLTWIYGATLALRRSAFEKLGGFDDTLPAAEDVDLCIRAHEAGLDLGFAPDAVVHCRLKSRVWDVVRQGRFYGQGTAAVEAKYRRLGRPLDHVGHEERGILHYTLSPLRLLPRARTRAGLGQVAFVVGRRLGYLQYRYSRAGRASVAAA